MTLTAGEAAAEQERVCQALQQALQLVSGLDQVASALRLADRVDFSPLRTRLEHANTRAADVLVFLRET
jgi:hypothetical protein